jgi:EAL domain-containing protein (putative c-di-GMP-specific phosphodiesterase class I)
VLRRAARAPCFEITEGTLVHRKELAISQLGKLRAKGLKILIDDFGTGYSSLSYLHSIPCDTIKLDGSFMREIAARTTSACSAIVAAQHRTRPRPRHERRRRVRRG